MTKDEAKTVCVQPAQEPIAWLATETVRWLREYDGPACAMRTAVHNRPITSDGGVPVYLKPAAQDGAEVERLTAERDAARDEARRMDLARNQFLGERNMLAEAMRDIQRGDMTNMMELTEAEAARARATWALRKIGEPVGDFRAERDALKAEVELVTDADELRAELRRALPALGLPELAATAGREPNGRAQRDAQNEGKA